MRAPAFWERRQAGFIASALSPFGAFYGAATARRMARPGVRLGAPVICVGNFTLGGAGKTPTALAIGKLLQARGERVAFLSRGYGGESRAAPVKVDSAMHSARAVGDEPLLLARVAPCWVGADRVAAGQAAIADGATVLVMDDGLQNPSLAKDLRLAVIDGEVGFGNGLCFPAGPLRAPVARQMEFVDAVVVAGGEAPRGLPREKPRFAASLRPDAVAAAPLVGRSVLAFAGIARPEKFFATLEALGARVAIRRAFADHHRFRDSELKTLIDAAEHRGLALVTTEKDLTRISQDRRAPIVALPVTLAFEDAKGFAAMVLSAIAERRAGAR
jgi:tetraacyldisaccharide 4'-kinase